MLSQFYGCKNSIGRRQWFGRYGYFNKGGFSISAGLNTELGKKGNQLRIFSILNKHKIELNECGWPTGKEIKFMD